MEREKTTESEVFFMYIVDMRWRAGTGNCATQTNYQESRQLTSI